MTEFTLTTQRPALLEGFDNEFHILAKIAGPRTANGKRDLENH